LYQSLATINPRTIIDLLAKAEAVDIGTPPSVSRDPKDNIFIATALAGRAEYLVSEDKDLLVLSDTLGFTVVDTEAFLRILQEREE
jgi:putative PIN family toxin of toxin-antitoxin system